MCWLVAANAETLFNTRQNFFFNSCRDGRNARLRLRNTLKNTDALMNK